MKVIISVAELLAEGKLEQAEDVVPEFVADCSPDNLATEITLTKEQAQRLGLLRSSGLSEVELPKRAYPI